MQAQANQGLAVEAARQYGAGGSSWMDRPTAESRRWFGGQQDWRQFPQNVMGVDEDYSAEGGYRRAFDEVAYQSGQDYYSDYPVTDPNAPVNPREISAIMRYRRANANKLILSRIPDTLERYPTLAAALANSELDEADARRLINLAELDSAYNAITSTSDPIRQRNIVLTMNPVQRAAFFDFFTAKVEELNREASQNPSWAESGWNAFYGGVVEPIINGLIFLNEKSQQTFRAGYMAISEAREEGMANVAPFAIPGVNTVAFARGISDYWDQVAPGVYDQEFVNGLRGEFGTEKVDTMLRLEELKRDGQPDPYGRWIAEYVGTPMEELVRSVTWRKYEDPENLELARLLNTADQGNTGMLLLSDFPEEWRSSSAYDVAAGAINVGATLFLDPTLQGAKIMGAYRAARYSLIKLSSAGGIDEAFRMRRTRVFFNALGKDLARLDDLDPAKRAVARDVIRRQYGGYLPANVIDDMAESGVRNADDANAWFVSKMVAESMLMGVPGIGQKFATTFDQIATATQAAKRQPLIPGKTTAGVMRSRFRMLAAIHNPTNRRFAERFNQRFGDIAEDGVDASQFGARLSDDAESIGAEAGAIPRRGPLGDFGRAAAQSSPTQPGDKPTLVNRAGAALGYRYADKSISARLDRIQRRFAKAPLPGAVYLNDGRDAGLIYDWARVFLTRQDAAIMADIWRGAPNQAVRKQIFNGLVKTHAAAKGVMLRDPSKSWRDFLPEVSRGGVYAPTLRMKRREDGIYVWDRSDEAVASADNQIATVDDIIEMRPSNFGGQEYPLHVWQTADYVRTPNFVDIERAGVKATFMGAMFGVTQGQVAQRIVDFWSLANLAGPRYYLRNSIEDYAFYAMTDGIWSNVYKGRRFGTTLRRVRGTKLGLVNRLLQGKARPIDDPDFSTKWQLIKSRFTDEDRAIAFQAMQDGDLSKVRELVGLAMARAKLTGWSKANQDDLMDFVTEHGAKLLDEANETATYGVSGLLPQASTRSYMVVADPTDGATNVKLVRPSKKWGDVSPNGDNPIRFTSWMRDLRGVADTDGAVGQAALAGILRGEPDEVLVPRLAQLIRDDEQVKWMDRFGALQTADATPELFASKYLMDVRNMVSLPNGKPNGNLLSLMRDSESGVFSTAKMSVDDLVKIPSSQRPERVLGQYVDEVPVPTSIKGFDKLWEIMGEQYARLSREPIFLANYLEQRTFLRPYEQHMAKQFGPQVARAKASRMATDRAYGLLLSYTDNPLNRTLLAWNVRNVARYYRATEDFARRALRVGKNYPQGFWKVGLTYDALEDTGFVFTDENDEKYFVFPGSELTINAVNWVMQRHPSFAGNSVLQMDAASYEMRGYVRMLSPSADPYQWIPTLSSPIAAVGVKSILAAFPALASFEQVVLGEYGENSDFWRAIMPGHVNRVWAAMERDERLSAYSSVFKDAVQVSAASGAMPGPDATEDEWEKYAEGLNTLVTTVLVLRAVGGFVLPAPPRLTSRDVTDFAREGGILNMDAAFREMIRVAQDEGSQNPFADGLVNYVQTFGIDAVPYSISTSEANDRFGSLNDLASVTANEEGEKWVKEHSDLVSGRYKTASAWLMPRLGTYSADQNRWLRNAGFKIPASYSDVFEKARIAEGRYVMLKNREMHEADLSAARVAYYNAVQSGDQTAAEAAWAEVRAVEDRWTEAQKLIKADYKGLEAFGTTTETIELNNESRKRLLDIEIRPMLQYIFEDRDRPVPPGAQNMADAIATFDLYATEIAKIEGSTNAEDLTKRMLRIEAEQLLNEIGGRDPNTQFFVDVILIPIFSRTYLPPGARE